jgi:hypothetical protein
MVFIIHADQVFDCCFIQQNCIVVNYFKVYALEDNALNRRMINSYVDANNLQSAVTVLNKPISELSAEDFDNRQVCFTEDLLMEYCVMCECYVKKQVYCGAMQVHC